MGVPLIRFGKSAGPLIALKQNFFQDNEALCAESERTALLYAAQPRRARCKCCDQALGAASFSKNGIDYVLCARCGHLNGAHEDSDAFCAALYTDAGGASYAGTYSAADRDAYWRRVRDIYVPKAEFLRDALAERDDAGRLAYADLGAGSGYFVAALRALGLERSQGYEVSEVQVALAERNLGDGAVRLMAMTELLETAATLQCDVVSMIGVLEHVQQPRQLLRTLQRNARVRYLFLSVPLFSPCVFLEMAFPAVFPRHLSGGHTHLYTARSLDWTCAEFGMTRAAEWWFGADMVDLFRAVTVELERGNAVKDKSGLWAEMFGAAIDDVQLALDRRKLASEVHMLLEFAR
jgi:hypothetical protein